MIQAFQDKIKDHQLIVSRLQTETLQINVGKKCNQACHHCHVDAGPKRTEIMNHETATRVIQLMKNSPSIQTVDITGGAPELNPHFRMLVTEASRYGKTIIDRCNLTVLFEEGQEDTAEFLRDHHVQVTASLPCYSLKNVDQQRGNGVFDKSIRALQLLNKLGYGIEGTGLSLNLVYNPLGAFLPGPQKSLEADYRRVLRDQFNVEFNQLFTITNMPIKRFHSQLTRSGQLQPYMTLLEEKFNPAAASQVMCRSLVSISWDGKIYDCDFNQMLEMPLQSKAKTIWEIESFSEIENTAIRFADHCYACTAGSGSSCGGALTASS